MGLFDFFKRKKAPTPEKKQDWTEVFPTEIVEPLLNEIKNNSQATNQNYISQGFGEFGLEKTNPIPVYGIPSNEEYLRSLRTNNDEVLSYRRTGSIEVENINNRVDEYELFNQQGDTIAFIYISPYHWKTSTRVPVGFYIKGRKKETFKAASHPLENFIPKSAYREYLLLKEQKEATPRTEVEPKVSETKFRTDSFDFQSVLKKYGITKLYHFTDKNNIKSIIQNKGLFSWFYCLQNNIDIPVPGGNQLSRELDYNKGLQNYVRVSFTRNHPMMFVEHNRNNQNVILEIDPTVILLNDSLYSDKNATRNDVNVGSTFSDFKKLRFDLFKHPNHFNLNEDDKPYYQGEILIKEHLPLEYILNIKDLI